MKRRVFIVEKDDAILEVITHILTEEGYQVNYSRSEEEAIESVLRVKPDIILLDIIKPTEAGTELCRTFKAHEQTKHIPLIVLSTHSKIPEIIKKICADDALGKPFDIYELINTIEEHLVE